MQNTCPGSLEITLQTIKPQVYNWSYLAEFREQDHTLTSTAHTPINTQLTFRVLKYNLFFVLNQKRKKRNYELRFAVFPMFIKTKK